jgi:ketosteroid isomerase-like protein
MRLRALLVFGSTALLWLVMAIGPGALAAQGRGGSPAQAEAGVDLERRIAEYFSAADLAAARTASSSIMALGAYGEFATQVPRGLLVRERGGWTARGDRQGKLLAAEVSREIDRILADPSFWREPAYDATQPCTGGARLMNVRHRGRARSSRQPCGPAGLTGRLAEIAVSGQLPRPVPAAVEQPSRRTPISSSNERAFPTQDPQVSRAIWEKSQSAASAWARGDLEAFLAPYAEDVAVVWPTGIIHGKEALRARARRAQAWNGRAERQMEVHSSVVRQISPHAALQTYQLRYSGGAQGDTQMWVTAVWQNRRGTWEVTHEQTGAETRGHTR